MCRTLSAVLRDLSPSYDAQETWFARAAAAALDRGHARAIHGRSHGDLYLARFWLSPPRTLGSGVLDSGASLLLHYIARPDDDGAVHDHPWDFVSRVIAGRYVELAGDGRKYAYATGATNARSAHDLHRIVAVDHDTWSLVTTGPKVRSWGFLSFDGKWRGWREHLGLPADAKETD